MNTIKRIHLARTPFNIEEEAQAELTAYLKSLATSAGSSEDAAELSKEVEGRIAEILADKGIVAEGVITLADVKAIRSQLGEPEDFAGSADDAEPAARTAKTLMRDPSKALLGGVMAGLSAYVGGNVWLWRLAALILFPSTHFLLVIAYIVAWATLPPAKTASDFLRMAGKPVTVDSLHRKVSTAYELSGFGLSKAALATRKTLATLVGASMIIGAVILLISIWVVAGSIFSQPLHYLFPVSGLDIAFVSAVVFAATVGAIVFIFGGSSLVIGGGAWLKFLKALPLLGVIWLIGVIASAGLAYPSISGGIGRYQAATSTTSFGITQPFNSVTATGYAKVTYVVSADAPRVEITRGPGAQDPDFSNSVKDGVLTLSAAKTDQPNNRHIPLGEDFLPAPTFTVYGPAPSTIKASENARLSLRTLTTLATLNVESTGNSAIYLPEGNIDTLTATSQDTSAIEGSSSTVKKATLTADLDSSIDLGAVGELVGRTPLGDNCPQNAPLRIEHLMAPAFEINGKSHALSEATGGALTCLNLNNQSF